MTATTKAATSPTYLFLDLETTGLDAAKCSILEVAAFMSRGTDRQEVINTPICYPVNMLGTLCWESAAFDMHRRKGTRPGGPGENPVVDSPSLLDVLESGAGVSLSMAEDKLLAAISQYPSKSVILAGNSIHFDMGFLKVHMPRLAAQLHYRLMDVSALVGFFEDALGVPRIKSSAVAHRALSDVVHSLQTYLGFRAGVRRMKDVAITNSEWNPAEWQKGGGG